MEIDADEIFPGLWMGSKPRRGLDYRAVGVTTIVLCAMEFQPDKQDFPGVVLVRAPMDDPAGWDDAEYLEENWQTAVKAAKVAVDVVRRGELVLVTCMQGRNRSGTVAALALWMLTGAAGRDVVAQVQELRKAPGVLSNRGYVNKLVHLPAVRR